MTILVDRPRWPSHGTRFAHLVSDVSFDELHAFESVLSLSLPRRLRFHNDHYDVPERAWQLAVDAGASVVSTHELVRRIRAAGLRARPTSAGTAPRRRGV
ncbi:MAG: hypothetical protein QOF59_1799 [Actinomycetota bacterium]|jgi:hypothetical protein|nr:hypothetical protein [Actinomycetota bacterium]MDQ1477439.1 hypothetical protein [Actinomycetota bacterium]